MSLSEFQIIEKYFNQHYQDPNVIKGIGDDCAILSVPDNFQLVVSMDTLVKGVHFPEQTSPYDIAYKALAVNLSDIAAMGAEPKWITLSLSIANNDESWLKAFAKGLFDCAKPYNVKLIGGDTVRSGLSITIQIHGLIKNNQALLRQGAKVGDVICVSNNLGEAAAGLHCVKHAIDADYLIKQLNQPTPQIKLGQALVGHASACIDISDGLSSDLSHILKQSEVGAQLDLTSLSNNPTLKPLFTAQQIEQFILHGGDDYQLCFTIKQNKLKPLLKAFPSIKIIGSIIAEQKIWLKKGQNCRPLTLKGYNHFG